ncbi:energy transducer TonB [Aliivibrio kagoshimensis]|uniref:energy transducer TonB n=1 Tax=Aliivibrio kagoshimensis TaxID=2910230 RepID=UPI003D11C450
MIRLLISMPIALAMTAILFVLMANIVEKPNNQGVRSASPLLFDVYAMDSEVDVQRRQRALPERPKTPQQPQSLALNSELQSSVSVASLPNTVPSITIAAVTDFGVAISMPSLVGLEKNQQAIPLYQVEPKYPPRALKRGMQGYVTLAFNIDEQGRTQDITVVEVEPSQIFVRSAIRALKKTKYQPKLVNGKAVKQLNQKKKFEFKINQ